jgi:hypothetical protein
VNAKGKWVLICLGVLIGLSAAAYGWRDRLIAPRLAALIRDALRQEMGLEVAIGRLGGPLVTGIEIEDLQTLAPGTRGPVTALTAKRVSIRYSPLALFAGAAGFVDAMRIEAEGLLAELDLGRGGPATPETAPSRLLPLAVPALQVRDATVAIRWGELHTRFEGISLDAGKDAAGGRGVRLSAADWSWSHPRLAAGRTRLSADLALAPGSVAIRALNLGHGRVAANGRIGPTGPNEPVPFEARLQLGGGRIELAGDAGAAALHLRLNAEDVAIEPIASLFLQPFSGQLSAEIDLAVPLDRPETSEGRLRIDLLNARIRGIELARASAEALLADGRVRLAEVQAISGPSRLTVGEAEAPLRPLLHAAWAELLPALSGRFELSCEDLPGFLAMIGLTGHAPPAGMPPHRLELSGRYAAGDLSIPRGELAAGPNRITLRNLETRLPPAPPDTPLKGALRMELPDLEALARVLPLLDLAGSLKADATIGGTHGRPEADAVVSGERLGIGETLVDRLSLTVRCRPQQLLLQTLSIRRGADTLSGSGSVRLPEGHIDAAEFSFDVADLEWLAVRLLPAEWTLAGERPRVQGRTQGTVRLSGPWSSPDGELNATFADLRLHGRRLGAGSMRVSKRRNTVAAHSVRLARGEDRLDLYGSFDLASERLGASRLQLSCAEIGSYLDAWAPRWSRMRGRASATLDVAGALDQPDGALALALERIEGGDVWLRDTRITARSAGRQAVIEAAETHTPAGTLRAAARLTWNPAGTLIDATLSEFSLKGEEPLLTLESPARLRYEADRRLVIERLAAGGPRGRIAVRGQLALAGGRSEIAAELAEVDTGSWLGRLTGMPLRVEGLDASLRLVGPAAAPEVRLEGTVRRLGAEDLALAGRFDLGYAGRRLRINAFDWASPAGHRLELAGALPIDPIGDPLLPAGALNLAAAVRVPDQGLLHRLAPAWPIAEGAIEAGLELEGSWSAPRGALRVVGRDLAPSEPAWFVPPGPYQARLEMSIDSRRLLLQTVDLHSAYARLRGSGLWQDYPPVGQWACGGAPRAGTVALEGRLTAPDLGWLARGLKDIRRVTGRLDADLKIEGPLSDPRLQGSLRLVDGELRPEADIPPVQALSVEAGFAGRDLTIRSLRGELGGAPFEVTGSIANLLTRGGQPIADLRLAGQNLLLQRSRTLQARADADLRLTGPMERLVLSGNLALTDGLFAKNFGLAEGLTAGSAKPKAGPGFTLFSFQAPPLRDLRFDVRISAIQPFQIRNNLAKGAVRPDLSLVGTGEAPELVGKIYLEATRLYLPAGRMQFDSGVIHFEAVDPGRPRLDMIGTARMIGYDITAVVAGPYDEPSVSLSSVPPLPDADLLALVLTGQPPKAPGGGPAENRQGLNVAVFIGRDVLMRVPGSDATESLQNVLERFDVELGRSVTRAGDETINARFRVADGVLRQGDTLYLTGEKDVFDQYNAGVRIVFRFR